MPRHTCDPGPVKEAKAPPIKCRDARNPVDPVTPLLRDQIECPHMPNATDCMERLGGTIVEIPCSLHASWLRKQGNVVDPERGFTADCLRCGVPLNTPSGSACLRCRLRPATATRTRSNVSQRPNPKREAEHMWARRMQLASAACAVTGRTQRDAG